MAKRVGSNQEYRGILVCGTGMGMAIIANKHPKVYAAVCESIYAAQIVNIWLKTEFTSEWEPPIQEWLHNSMKEISQLEQEQFG